jgi:hypothetical protein
VTRLSSIVNSKINCCAPSKIHGLVACGGEDGAVECFDMRKKTSVGRINIPAVSSEDYSQVHVCNLMKIKDTLWQWGPVQERYMLS